MNVIEALNWPENGLLPAVVQDVKTLRVLMLAWLNREALQLCVSTGEAHFWSRSRSQLWRKGESSGHVQRICELRLDCDEDAILLLVEQVGVACHTGRETCFYQQWQPDAAQWMTTDAVLIAPETMYKKP